MSTLASLSSSYYYGYYVSTAGDVADIITNVRNELVTRNSPAWTEPSTNLFKSPVDGAGRWHDVLLTRIDQQTIEMRIRDQLGRTCCTRRIQTGTLPFAIYIYSGQFHLIIDVVSPGGASSLYSGIFDQSPDAQGSYPGYVYGSGYLSNTNTYDACSTVAKFFMYDQNGGAYNADLRLNSPSNSYSGSICYNINGSRIYRPVECSNKWDASYNRVVGRRYQQLLCSDTMPCLARVSVPIDNVSGLFQVTYIPNTWGYRIMARIQ